MAFPERNQISGVSLPYLFVAFYSSGSFGTRETQFSRSARVNSERAHGFCDQKLFTDKNVIDLKPFRQRSNAEETPAPI